MANKAQKTQKCTKKEKGLFKKTHVQTEYQRERDAAKQHKRRKHPAVVEA